MFGLEGSKDPRVGQRRTWVSNGIKVWAFSGHEKMGDGSFRQVYSVGEVIMAAGDLARVKFIKTGEETLHDVCDLYDYIPQPKVAIPGLGVSV